MKMKKWIKRSIYMLVVAIKVPFQILATPWIVLQFLDEYMEEAEWW